MLVTLTTVCSFFLGFYWKHRPGHCCFPCFKSTNQCTVHPFPTRVLAWLDFNESGALWLCRLVGSLLFVKSLGSLLHLLMLPKKKIYLPNSSIKSSIQQLNGVASYMHHIINFCKITNVRKRCEPIKSCHVTSCHVTTCHVMSFHVMSNQITFF